MKKIFIGIIAIILLAALAVFLFVNNIKPKRDGTVNLEGLNKTVEIYYDDFAVPHIYAQSEEDAYFALGYAHAKERLFQMEMIRRLASGSLSEVLGESLLETDVFFRTLSIDKHAEWSAQEFLKHSDKPYFKAANAYLKGLNTFLEEGKMPLEFTILGIPKRQFTIKDFYLTTGYMAFSFAAAFKTDPLIDKINKELGANYLNDLVVHWDESMVTIPITNRDSIYEESAEEMVQLSNKINQWINESIIPVALLEGSNGWAISGKRSKSGKPILCNDTHIGYSQPATWFEAHVEYPGFSFYGNHLAMFPFAPIGHTDKMAVGITMFENDDIDFYTETINPENEKQVMFKGEWVDILERQEIFKLKNKDTTITIRETPHGPIVSNVLGAFKGNEAAPQISMWWTMLKAPGKVLEASYNMMHANNIEEFEEAVSLIDAPGLNIMYADAEDNIAWFTAAKLVKRPAHVNSKLFLDGASGKDEMLGFYPFSLNPKSVNPASGFVYSANNQGEKVFGDQYYPGYYLADDRADKIMKHFSNDKVFDIENMKKIQADDTSLTALRNIKEIFSALDNSKVFEKEENAKIREILQSWKGEHQLESKAPTIYYKLIFNILQQTFEDKLGKDSFKALMQTHMMHRSLPMFLANNNSVWWDNISTKETQETRFDIFERAIVLTSDFFKNELNDDSKLAWKYFHTLEHVHPIGRQAPFDKLFNVGPFPMKGGKEVINNTTFTITEDGKYKVTGGPAMRIIIDMSDPRNSLSVLPTGQSGHVMSKFYDDQAKMYNNNEYRKQMRDEAEIKEKCLNVLRLEPK
jgi:penicillin G amidase